MPRPIDAKSTPMTAIALAAIFLLLLGYPLSVGPASWMLNSGVLPQSSAPTLEGFYFPLVWLHSNSETCKHFLDAYVELFE